MRLDPQNETVETIASLARQIDALQRDVSAIRRSLFLEHLWGWCKLAIILIPLAWATVRWLPVVTKFYSDTQRMIQHVEKFLPK